MGLIGPLATHSSRFTLGTKADANITIYDDPPRVVQLRDSAKTLTQINAFMDKGVTAGTQEARSIGMKWQKAALWFLSWYV